MKRTFMQQYEKLKETHQAKYLKLKKKVKCIICSSAVKHVYFINPRLFFCGNRTKMYPENVVIYTPKKPPKNTWFLPYFYHIIHFIIYYPFSPLFYKFLKKIWKSFEILFFQSHTIILHKPLIINKTYLCDRLCNRQCYKPKNNSNSKIKKFLRNKKVNSNENHFKYHLSHFNY